MRNEKLSGLDPLVGEWVMEASSAGQPMGRARAVFEWAQGGAFLIQHASAEPPDAIPPGPGNPLPLVTMFGLDDHSGTYAMLYADARGVFRVYQCTVERREWKVWGQAGPEFYQRFSATIDPGGTLIEGAWERSADGVAWEHDFAVRYRKAG
jgi:hypothetical protein